MTCSTVYSNSAWHSTCNTFKSLCSWIVTGQTRRDWRSLASKHVLQRSLLSSPELLQGSSSLFRNHALKLYGQNVRLRRAGVSSPQAYSEKLSSVRLQFAWMLPIWLQSQLWVRVHGNGHLSLHDSTQQRDNRVVKCLLGETTSESIASTSSWVLLRVSTSCFRHIIKCCSRCLLLDSLMCTAGRFTHFKRSVACPSVSLNYEHIHTQTHSQRKEMCVRTAMYCTADQK